MRRWLAIAATFAATPLAVAQAQDWNLTYGEGERHVVGNPQADTKLIEYVSYTCPHCASFERESDAAMRMVYIQSGQVAVEVRHLIRNPIDLAAALMAECGPKEKFFGNHRVFLHAQDRWLPKAAEATQAQQRRWVSGSLSARMRAIADDLDFHDLMEPRGYSRSELDRCLTDEAKAQRIAEQSQADIAEYDVPGTPSFVINGTLLEGAHSWASLQPALSKATATTAE